LKAALNDGIMGSLEKRHPSRLILRKVNRIVTIASQPSTADELFSKPSSWAVHKCNSHTNRWKTRPNFNFWKRSSTRLQQGSVSGTTWSRNEELWR